METAEQLILAESKAETQEEKDIIHLKQIALSIQPRSRWWRWGYLGTVRRAIKALEREQAEKKLHKKALYSTCYIEPKNELFTERLQWLLLKQGPGAQTRTAKALGISESALRYYKIGQVTPSLPVAVAMAKYFGVTLDYLAGLSDEGGKRK